jgi:hypothetical protein
VTQFRRQTALSVDVRAFVEAHLRDLAVAGRLNELARSRYALANRYRAEGNDAAVYCLASAPDFSLAVTPGGGVLLTLRRSGDLVSWTRSELLAEAPDAAKEVESRATQLAGGPERFRTLSDDQREVLTTQAAEELIRQQRGG